MNSTYIVIRIKAEDKAVDWTVEHPNQLTFTDTLAVLAQVCPTTAVPAFEYVDEDGDRITVRSDEELAAMISFYLSTCSSKDQPLVIFPEVIGKSPGKRNIDGLKVKTGSGNEMECDSSPVLTDQGSSRKRSGDIRQILAGGNVADKDLKYLEVLGRGSCGTVYKAQHRPSSAIMAVKVISLDISVDAQKQIMSELEVLYRCHCAMIISFYGAYFVENRISICTEYMDGGSLDRYGQIPEEILGPVAASVVRGLQYLWGLKIMHRDVKPSNILVNTQGQVKLCDFGVSVQLIDSIAKTFIGTNAYMAPERINGQQYSIHSDVWSLGISLFEMAAGRFPYQSPMDLLKSILEKDPPQLPREVFPDMFVDFVSQCMQMTPLQRPAPEALMRHPYIKKFSDKDSHTIIAGWVNAQLAARQT
ncbi:Dual specificity mitogen-activated protein kinase kinase 5 [Lamellibrachia satsuma]|nr:Dual specificity mitogen-activated protein kinase kinase 5 [Lamellibrachia satsuma]